MARLLGFLKAGEILFKIYDGGDDFCCVAHKNFEKIAERWCSKWYSDLLASEQRALETIVRAVIPLDVEVDFLSYQALR